MLHDKMRIFILLFFLAIQISFLSAQNKVLDGLFFNYQMGFAQLEKQQEIRTNANVIAAGIGKEFSFAGKYGLATGVGVHTYYAEYSGNTAESSMVSIPIRFRMYSGSTNSKLYAGFGLDNKFKLKDEISNLTLATKIKGENAYHLGMFAEMGYRTSVLHNLDFLIGLNYNTDVLTSGYNQSKTKFLNGVNLSLGLQLPTKKNR